MVFLGCMSRATEHRKSFLSGGNGIKKGEDTYYFLSLENCLDFSVSKTQPNLICQDNKQFLIRTCQL